MAPEKVDTSFLGGAWQDVTVRNSTFSGVFWSAQKQLSLAATTSNNVSLYGGKFEPIVAVSVAFINTKFRGAITDTTNLSKVGFAT